MRRKSSLLFGLVSLLVAAVYIFLNAPSLPAFNFQQLPDEGEMVRRALQAKGWEALTPTSVLRLEIDASPLDGEEIILGINAGKNKGFLAGLQKADGRLIGLSKDLASVTRLSAVELPGIAQKGISVEEYYDNRTGGFEETTWKRIFRLDENNAFQQVFSHVQKSEYFWHDAWDRPDGIFWHRVKEENHFSIPAPGVIVVDRTVSRYKIPGDPKKMPTQYNLESEEKEKVRFDWNAASLRFVETARTPVQSQA
ncbi:hypothetical protein HM1_2037 [Heliomicrobium modesticaldum Ice1]|uniref:Uncharacterized protein n=1 Tax=Heliobacterium modesticaldum (strain ATCC 51547 / Ice1) TaxID=498761 RepID=B0TG98_HELMI|nr:hypothetical protein [Heliomicrobium modesticaldum]ABZ84594.1 hypothetical protein HM1_2037 [Heliomicrobium modesticaldum Ice1]